VETTESTDGTAIAYQRTGSGPTLVLVVGAFCDMSSTAGLAPLLAAQHTVVEYDRRGRGASGAGRGWSVQQEVDDLAAVIGANGGSAAVYGHSSGGALALEAAAAGVPVRRLAVYEPPYTADATTGSSDELLDGVRERIDAGDPDGAAVLFLTASGTPAEVVGAIQQGPGWPRMRALAPTLVNDLALANGGSVPRGRLGRIRVPTLAVSGGSSPAWATRACAAVAAAVPGARTSVLAGQHHGVAHDAVAPLLAEWFRN
jgi:pimeloyl-ACP methyl ester carboxylesterase